MVAGAARGGERTLAGGETVALCSVLKVTGMQDFADGTASAIVGSL